MSNGMDHTDKEDRTDELLDRLIRAAALRTPQDFTWPPDETILAYIQGRATEPQRETIQRAAARSSEFRRFLVDTTAQLSAAMSEDAIETFDAVRIPSHLNRTDDAGGRLSLGRLRKWFEQIRRPLVLVPVLTGAAAVVVMLSYDPIGLFTPRSSTFAQYAELDRSLFVRLSVRGGTAADSTPVAAPSAYEAALSTLRASIVFDIGTGTYTLKAGTLTVPSTASSRTWTLRIVDETGSEIGRISSPAAQDDQRADSVAEAWVLVPPSLILWHLTVPNDSLDIKWPLERPARGCATFTHKTDSGYIAAPAQIFQL